MKSAKRDFGTVRRLTPVTTAAVLAALGLMLWGCGPGKPDVDPVQYGQDIKAWQLKRLQRLTTETGWLTLAGLGWLKQGENRVGSDSANAVVTPPGKAPAWIGSIFLKGDSMTFRAAKGVEVTSGGKPVREIALLSDEAPEPTQLRYGTLLLYVIKRGDQLGVRIKDSQNPARVNFKGLDYFPIDLKYRFTAKFYPYTPVKILEIPTQAGTVEKEISPGALGFSLNGNEYRIDAVIEKGSEDQLFIMFSDATSGNETYGPGRQLYTGLPDSNNTVVLDFNRAYNWPCVFTVFATCPIPPRQNAIADRIEAGEKMYHDGSH
jgi:uncharacterized protein (DUF1684 family)